MPYGEVVACATRLWENEIPIEVRMYVHQTSGIGKLYGLT